MKSSFRGFVLALMAMVLCLTALMPAALAADGLNAGPISVEITLSGTLPRPAETYTVRLTALDNAYPMPEGATEGVYDIKITGAGTGEIPVITYGHVGIYKYTITQLKGDNPRCTYDERVYNVTVSVINQENGSIGTVIAIHEGDNTDKVQKVVFHNRYPTIVVPTPSPTPSPTPTAEPSPTPTATPESTPTAEPTATPEPTDKPTARPTQRPTNKPTTPPGDITQTGVADRWPLYAAGCAALLVAAFFIVKSLRRKEDTGDGNQ